jgi:hypothetical protein
MGTMLRHRHLVTHTVTSSLERLLYSEEFVESQPTFRRNISPPSSGSKNTLGSCSEYFSALKMKAICSSEKSVDFQRTTRPYIPEDGTLQNVVCFY